MESFAKNSAAFSSGLLGNWSTDRRQVLKALVGTSAALVTGAGFTGIASAQDTKTVVALVQPDISTLGQYLSSALATSLVASKIYDGLLEYDFDLKPKPSLAESFEVSEDGLTVTFKLRPGVVFHDGKPFTSADVQFSILEVLKNFHPRGSINFKEVEAIETPDELTAVFKLAKPAPYMISALSGYEAPMVPKHLFEGTDIRDNEQANAPIGTGPFKFVEWRRGQFVRLEKNENYWQPGLPKIDRLVFRYIPDAGTRTAAIESGEVQVAGFGAVFYSDVRHLETVPGMEVTQKGYEMISPVVEAHFNTKRAPFDQVKVRQAISYALDRQFIIDNVWFGFGKPATGPISSNFAATGLYTSDVRNYNVPDRVGQAKKLLDEAGFPEKEGGIRFEMTIDPTPYGEEWRRFGEYVIQALNTIGIKASMRYEDVPTWLKRIYTDYDYDMMLSWISNLADPVTGIHREYHSNSIRPGAVFVNATQWSTPETDALMDQAANEKDPARRAELYHQFQKLVVEAAPTIWIMELQFSTVTSDRVKDAVVSPLGLYANFAQLDIV
ncbi:ABC transporter substrate-binding protein [Mesorhizobium sp. YM1C-6-2]|uniref:ABC transporter substrate-binding protein n=1 Tax=Mesorhizobium sp. YM1C-6-2 TaxID=1827501 RepID=UPI0016039C39|nr:ABC transporter substrate-binding protein [Mesorhizobium sp. YM1C-6-2]